MTRARWAALGMAVLLALYLVLITFYAVRLVTDTLPIVRGIGWALIVLPLLGAWALAVELRFGVRAERLARLLEAEGGIPREGQVGHGEAGAEGEDRDAVFARYADDVREHPESWQQWFRLGLAYDASRDRQERQNPRGEAPRRETPSS